MIELAVNVRTLAEFCYRRGDIDHRFTPSPTGLEGIEGHQRVAAQRPASWQAEYSLEHRAQLEGVRLTLRGRADGYDAEAGLVEEIKTCRAPAERIPEAVNSQHLAQARLYAAMIAARDQVDRLRVRLTWFNIDSGEQWCLDEEQDAAQLQDFLQASLQRFSSWIQAIAGLRQERDESLALLAFPYPDFRDGQRDIAELVYKCIDQGGRLMVEAATGIGKTAAVLFPALKALHKGKYDKLLYLTAKTSGRLVAEQTLAHFRAAGFRGNALTITARDRICLSPGKACHGEDCPYARGYYDRLGEAMADSLRQTTLTREDIEDLARRYQVCPYQLGMDLLPWVDLVIADVHYLYSLPAPFVHRMQDSGDRWTALLDEAHNLPGRALGMYSATLRKVQLMAARNEAAGAVRRALERCNRACLALQRDYLPEPGEYDGEDSPGQLADALQRFVAEVGEQLAEQPAWLQARPRVMDFFFDTLQFLRVMDEWGDEYRLQLTRTDARQGLEIALTCLDPGRLLGQRHSALHAVTSFSATLTPRQWMCDSLGLPDTTVWHRQASPFDADQLLVTVDTGVDTRYRQRDASLSALVTALQRWLAEVTGNCMVFFPSYRYMRDCLDQLKVPAGRELWQQASDQGDAERGELLQRLSDGNRVAAFCILGGVFGEGIDLPGDLLDSVVIVGVGLPQVNRNTRLQQAWFARRYGNGFEYAFLYPGMQKVSQALGRVIRRQEDRGAALLIDARYRQPEYRQLLPAWWAYKASSDH